MASTDSSPSSAPPDKTHPTLYFGYGSNLWLHQMHLRCLTSEYVGIARLNGYRWMINSRGYANVVEVEKKEEGGEGEDGNDNGERQDGRQHGRASTFQYPDLEDYDVVGEQQQEQQRETQKTNDKNEEATDDDNDDDDNVVYGLVYTLLPADEARLDVNEGVPHAYTKEYLPVEFWHAPSSSTTTTTTTTINDKEPHKKIDVGSPPDEAARKMLVYINRKLTKDSTPKEEYVHRINKGVEDAVRLGVPERYVRRSVRKFVPAEDEVGKMGEGVERLVLEQAMNFRDGR